MQDAERHLAASSVSSALVAAAIQTHAWLHGDGVGFGTKPLLGAGEAAVRGRQARRFERR